MKSSGIYRCSLRYIPEYNDWCENLKSYILPSWWSIRIQYVLHALPISSRFASTEQRKVWVAGTFRVLTEQNLRIFCFCSYYAYSCVVFTFRLHKAVLLCLCVYEYVCLPYRLVRRANAARRSLCWNFWWNPLTPSPLLMLWGCCMDRDALWVERKREMWGRRIAPAWHNATHARTITLAPVSLHDLQNIHFYTLGNSLPFPIRCYIDCEVSVLLKLSFALKAEDKERARIVFRVAAIVSRAAMRNQYWIQHE
jgi:hypothetical protein